MSDELTPQEIQAGQQKIMADQVKAKEANDARADERQKRQLELARQNTAPLPSPSELKAAEEKRVAEAADKRHAQEQEAREKVAGQINEMTSMSMEERNPVDLVPGTPPSLATCNALARRRNYNERVRAEKIGKETGKNVTASILEAQGVMAKPVAKKKKADGK